MKQTKLKGLLEIIFIIGPIIYAIQIGKFWPLLIFVIYCAGVFTGILEITIKNK